MALRRRTAEALSLGTTLVAALLVACHAADEPRWVGSGPLVVAPTRLSLRAGDTASVTVVFALGARSISYRWASVDTTVLALETSPAVDHVRVRAARAGATTLRLTVVSDGNTYVAEVPATVSAALRLSDDER
jgi:hypothetical protein